MDSQDDEYESAALSSNESRFLLEELNLDDQPTHQQIIERAQELEIDDLVMACESLTKKSDPEWKPYCNRKGQVYYINLQQAKAYADHPVDMYYKKLYARKNGMVQPKFPSYSIEEIATNLFLIEQEIQAYYGGKQIQGLNIVYEEPSEQNLSQSKSHPLIDQQQSIPYEQKQSQLKYTMKLQQHYDEELQRANNNLHTKLETLRQEHNQMLGKIAAKKIEQYIYVYKQELVNKNQLDLQKQKLRLLSERETDLQSYQAKVIDYRSKYEQLRKEQSQIEHLYQCKEIDMKINMVQKLDNEHNCKRQSKYRQMKANLIRDFDAKIFQLSGNTKDYQNKLLKDLQKIWNSQADVDRKSIAMNLPRSQHTIKKTEAIEKRGNRIPIFHSHQQPISQKCSNLSLWSQNDIFSTSNKPTVLQTNKLLPLCQRLQLRIL